MNVNRQFLKKHWSNLIAVLAIVLLIVPQTGTPIKVAVQRLFAFSPVLLSEDKQSQLNSYDWPLQSLDGSTVNLKQSDGKVVLINFWATWCPPCIAEMPAMQKLYTKYGDAVDFYFVSSEDPEKLKQFLADKNYQLPVYVQKYAAPAALNGNALPTTYLIDKSGSIVVKETGAKGWDSEKFYSLLDELLAR